MSFSDSLLLKKNNKIIMPCLMLKNEEKRIITTLESTKSVIDKLCILDTGSTDNTIKLIRDYCNENKIELHLLIKDFTKDDKGKDIPFDFRKSRNCLLDFANTIKSDWLILLDCNDEIRYGYDLRIILENYKGAAIGFYIQQEWNYGPKIETYPNIRIIKPNSGWSYGATIIHEALVNNKYDITKSIYEPDNKKVVDFIGIKFYQDREKDNDKSSSRFRKDKIALLSEYEKLKDKKDLDSIFTRTLFYLGQTCLCLGDYTDSFKYYFERTKYNVFQEEIYLSFYNCGQLSINLNHDIEEIVMWFTKAFETNPRAEPLFYIASIYFEEYKKTQNKSKLLLAYMYSKQTTLIDYPYMDLLFVDKQLYDYKRWKLLALISYKMNKKEYETEYKECIDKCILYIKTSKNKYLEKDLIELNKENIKCN